MKVIIDQSKCTGHARCAAVGPDVYPLDDEGYNALRVLTHVAPGYEGQAVEGADLCPEGAITVLD